MTKYLTRTYSSKNVAFQVQETSIKQFLAITSSRGREAEIDQILRNAMYVIKVRSKWESNLCLWVRKYTHSLSRRFWLARLSLFLLTDLFNLSNSADHAKWLSRLHLVCMALLVPRSQFSTQSADKSGWQIRL